MKGTNPLADFTGRRTCLIYMNTGLTEYIQGATTSLRPRQPHTRGTRNLLSVKHGRLPPGLSPRAVGEPRFTFWIPLIGRCAAGRQLPQELECPHLSQTLTLTASPLPLPIHHHVKPADGDGRATSWPQVCCFLSFPISSGQAPRLVLTAAGDAPCAPHTTQQAATASWGQPPRRCPPPHTQAGRPSSPWSWGPRMEKLHVLGSRSVPGNRLFRWILCLSNSA